ncbi:hypothetical protein BO78DRAFT_453386 [Aspergillus sclerotiicarbonarius CBS 121057]|uniref:Uncharacterized protein n=1 Tax=Aspergillus sclerotiicarbonarius (strain CBS 121057 / IBT 28362) TaxID=1448318 RepID=A0A319DY15_ASPSB|nr:hypothetical protein BO78DRAFT_453386 [Aspergillus sclerotiicarbonarius CBS 121057]
MAAVAAQLADLTGLMDLVRVVVGREAYLADLWLLEELGVLRGQSVMVADNVIMPGVSRHLEWVRAETREKRG